MRSKPSTQISPERIRALPELPGVYLMKDAEGTVLYVGKAKDLRSRVRSYFSGGDERHSVQFLIERAEIIDTIVTHDERQALLLEADLIRKYKPRYNIRLKDDKAYLMVRIDESAEWPRIELVRSQEDDGARYLGPFTFGYELRTVLDVIKRIVPLRTCSDHVLRNRVRPCIEYQIKRCAAPCCIAIDRGQYAAWIEQAVRMLQGKDTEVIEQLESEMARASEELRFEDAAGIRDRLEVLKKFRDDNTEVLFGGASQDAIGLHREGSRVEISVLIVRRGRLLGAKSFGFEEAAVPNEELLGSFLLQYYGGDTEVPELVLLPLELEDCAVFEEMYSERRGRKVTLSVPKIGSKARLLGLALENARENFTARFSGVDNSEIMQRSLQKELELESTPRTVECVDIAHFQGGSTVAAVVCFKDGKPDKSRYRHFVLTQEGKPDDFASMREVVMRHLSRCAEENTLSDLMVIDGGPAQLSQALKQRKELGLNQPAMIGLAKKRSEKLPYRAHRAAIAKLREKKPERIYCEGREEPIVLPPESETLHLLERVRDEAHRFAGRLHRNRRAKKVFQSQLEGIQGVGDKRRKKLLRTFGSLKAIAALNPEELSVRGEIPMRLAERIIETLRRRLVAPAKEP
ncbi:MAG: excinuclease ABC subunit UvrC [Bdellovibrionota bacterium]